MAEFRIGVDARSVYRSTTRGIGNYLQHLLREMLVASENSFRLYYDAEPAAKPFALSRRVHDSRLAIRGSRLFTWEQCALPSAVRRDRMDLLHCPGNTLPWWQPCPTVLTLHDVALTRLDNGEDARWLFYWRNVMPHCIAKASLIITDSEFSKQEIIQTIHLPAEKIRVVHLGADPFFCQLSPPEVSRLRAVYKLPGEFIFALGAESPHKNTRRLVEAFREMKKCNACSQRLVVAGLQPGILQELRAMLQESPLSDEVVLLGFIDKEMLRFLYNAADLFVFPSLYEGFGFPVLEAMACGAPVAASNRASIPEVAGIAALFFNPEDVHAIQTTMEQVLSSHSLAEDLRAKGLERVKRFRWDKAARATLDVYRQALDKNS